MHTPKLNKTASGIYYVYAHRRKVYLGKDDPRIIKERYRAFLSEYFTRNKEDVQSFRFNLTVKKLADEFILNHADYYVKRGRQTGQLERFKVALSFPVALFPELPVDYYRSRCLMETRDAMLNSERFSRKYTNTLINCIRHVFSWGVEQELVMPDTLVSLKALTALKRGRTVARETEPVLPVSPEAVDKTIPFLPKVIQAMVTVQRHTGMRPVEVCIMRVRDLKQYEGGYLYTLDSDKTDYRREASDKRVVPIGATAARLIDEQLDGKGSDDFVFSSDARVNRAYRRESYTRAISRAAKKAGVESWSPNQLRHAFATEVRKKFGLEAAQVLLGHKNANVTQIYAERDFSLALRVLKVLG